MDVKKKILFIIPSMRGGGSERVVSIILNHLDKEEFEPILVLLQMEGVYLSDLPDDLKIIDLKTDKTRYSIFKIIKTIYSIKPDVIMTTLSHLNILLALLSPLLPSKTKFVSRESSIVSINNENSRYTKLLNYLYKNFYSRFDKTIAQSNSMKIDLIKNYAVYESKIDVINNPLDLKNIERLAEYNTALYNSEKFNILIVGRLSYEKNHLDSFRVMQNLDDSFHLTILGDGNLKDSLHDMAKEMNIADKISFVGFDNNPYKYMKQADVVILTSFYEGFPNVLLESIACGTPIVTFDCMGSAEEIVKDGVNGYLIPNMDINKLKSKIIHLSKNKLDAESIKKTAIKYDVSIIVKMYEKVFKKLSV